MPIKTRIAIGWFALLLLVVGYGVSNRRVASNARSILLKPPASAPRESGGNKQEFGSTKSANAAPDNAPSEPQASAISDIRSDKQSGPDGDKSAKQNEESASLWWTKADVILTAIFSTCLVAVAALQLVLMWMQSHYMRDEMKATQAAANAATQTVEMMRLEQRAWLTLSATIGELVPNRVPKCELTIMNTGKTPGTIDAMRITAFAAAIPVDFNEILRLHSEVAREEIRETVVPPDGTRQFVLKGLPVFDSIKIQNINEVTESIVFLVTVAYSDVMQRTHHTRYCSVFDAPSRTIILHDKHNYMQ